MGRKKMFQFWSREKSLWQLPTITYKLLSTVETTLLNPCRLQISEETNTKILLSCLDNKLGGAGRRFTKGFRWVARARLTWRYYKSVSFPYSPFTGACVSCPIRGRQLMLLSMQVGWSCRRWLQDGCKRGKRLADGVFTPFWVFLLRGGRGGDSGKTVQ